MKVRILFSFFAFLFPIILLGIFAPKASAYCSFFGTDNAVVTTASSYFFKNPWSFDIPTYRSSDDARIGRLEPNKVKKAHSIDIYQERVYIDKQCTEYIPIKFFAATFKCGSKVENFSVYTNTDAKIYRPKNPLNNFSWDMGIKETDNVIAKKTELKALGACGEFITISIRGEVGDEVGFIRCSDLYGFNEVDPEPAAPVNLPRAILAPDDNDPSKTRIDFRNLGQISKVSHPKFGELPPGSKGKEYKGVFKDDKAECIYSDKNGILHIPQPCDEAGNVVICTAIDSRKYFEDQSLYVGQNKNYVAVLSFALEGNQFAHVIFLNGESLIKVPFRRLILEDVKSDCKDMLKVDSIVFKQCSLTMGRRLLSPFIWSTLCHVDSVNFPPCEIYNATDTVDQYHKFHKRLGGQDLGVHCNYSIGYLMDEMQSIYNGVMSKDIPWYPGARVIILPPGKDIRQYLSSPAFNGGYFSVASGLDGVDTTSKYISPYRPEQRLPEDRTLGPRITEATLAYFKQRSFGYNPYESIGVNVVNGFVAEDQFSLGAKLMGISSAPSLPNNSLEVLRRVNSPSIQESQVFFSLIKKCTKSPKSPERASKKYSSKLQTLDQYVVVDPRARNKVNLVLSSAIDVSEFKNSDLQTKDMAEKNSRIVLSFSYYATFLQAGNSVYPNNVGGINGHPTNPNRIVVLSLLGGGAYQNRPEDIFSSMLSRPNAFIAALCGLDVMINLGSHVLTNGEKKIIDAFTYQVESYKTSIKNVLNKAV
ncbi:MAG: hypothetical protein LBH37_02540 [Oscillospiraceae bacterium]|jgi:hypothetical protein|nr:hypothetical protein [Oscillospiraceae bacterium]